MKTHSLSLLIVLLGVFGYPAISQSNKFPQWTTFTHENDSTPSYATVFPKEKVNRIDLVISPENWKKLTANLEKSFGAFGKDSAMGFPPMGQMPDSAFQQGGRPHGPMGRPGGGFPCPPSGGRNAFGPMAQMPDSAFLKGNMPQDSMRITGRGAFPGPPPGGMGPMGMNEENIWVPCTFYFDGKQWYSVGLRFKGNSSMMMSWQRGIKKMPLRFRFNKFKDSIPELDKQRFYGFKELSFSNNSNDLSLVRERLANEIFSESGVNAPQTAFYQVYIDYGEGPVYFGLYTAIEIVEDAMLKTQFGNNTGNVYKPEGGSFAKGTFKTSLYEKKNNKKESDFSDLEALYNILHSSLRKNNPTTWKKKLEKILDVPAFMRWLAVNNTIENWDTYGQMPHNYYLYHNPATGKLIWIPWDNNEALDSKRMEMGSLSLDDAGDNWPLIRYLMDVPEYKALYKKEMQNLISSSFKPEYIKSKLQKYHQLLAPYAVGTNGEKKGYTFLNSASDFDQAFIHLEKHLTNRNLEAEKYLHQ